MLIKYIGNLTFHYWWLFLISILLFFAVLIFVPVFSIKLPADYFSKKENKGSLLKILFPFNYIFLIIKNSIGFLFVGVGIILLFIPGQGLLTIFTGLMLLNFPDKRRLELFLVRKKPVLNTINWIREKAGKPRIKDIYSS